MRISHHTRCQDGKLIMRDIELKYRVILRDKMVTYLIHHDSGNKQEYTLMSNNQKAGFSTSSNYNRLLLGIVGSIMIMPSLYITTYDH